MTNTDISTSTSTSTSTDSGTAPIPGPDDPRTAFAHATITARAVIAEVRPDQLALPTPCPEHDVRSLLGHMLTVFNRLAALGEGADPMAMPDVVTGVADDAWSDEFQAAAQRVQAAWTDAAKLDELMVLPWATAPGAAMVHMYSAELTVHTWDLAIATGQTVEWHGPTVDAALATALQALPSGDREAYFEQMAQDPKFSPELAVRPPFRNIVPVGDDASALDRLIGWYGRQPSSAA
jgi:uncharacterized protein (TIGR03086 family)